MVSVEEKEAEQEEEDLVIVSVPRLPVIEEEKSIPEATVGKANFIRPGLARKESRVEVSFQQFTKIQRNFF